jgi:hypothetical protein
MGRRPVIAQARPGTPALLADARVALAMASRPPYERPTLFLGVLAALVSANLFRFWLGAAGGRDDAPLVQAAGWLFLVVRTCGNLWLHVAAMRLVAQPDTPWRRAFAILPVQAGWFHLVAAASLVTIGIRLWLGQGAGGVFVPAVMTGGTAIGIAVGLGLTYLIFLPLQPGFARVLLRAEPVSLGWSLRAIRGQYWYCWALAMILAYPPAVLRMLAFGGMRQDDAVSVLATALVDGAMSVLLMLLATSVYLLALGRAEARQP